MAFQVIAGGIIMTAARRIIWGIVGGIANMLRTRIGQFVALGIIWAGLSFGTNEVLVQPSLDMIEDHMTSGVGGGDFGVAMLGWLGVMRLDEAVSMIVSAYAGRKIAQAGRVFLKRST